MAVLVDSYLALSLEALRWDVYAVTGKLGKGKILRWERCSIEGHAEEFGEEAYSIQVSDEEMKNVVESVYERLPEVE
ncbi:MAG: hypothetical protein LZF86_50149 [Nitrospira sp.]|nr:MAG: hypothetical protein LZF86_50149 [Nitrospira sp.]